MPKKTNSKWYTANCGRCGEAHYGYTGKLDSKGIEYVVCERTNKRMNISGNGISGNTFAFPTKWVNEAVGIAEILRDDLENISKEEFDKIWKEIEAKNLGGPTLEEFKENYM